MNSFRRPMAGLIRDPAPFLAMSEEEFKHALIDAGWSEQAAESELEERREYERRFVVPAPVVPEPDLADPNMQAVLRRRTKKRKPVDEGFGTEFDPEVIADIMRRREGEET